MPRSNDHTQIDVEEEDLTLTLDIRCEHEAAHAVFAYHDDIQIVEVWVSPWCGGCTIYHADVYEHTLPWEYALFSLVGAYAGYARVYRKYPTLSEFPLSWLLKEAKKVPKGDAWYVIEMLNEAMLRKDNAFLSLEQAYACLLARLRKLVGERQDEIETVAFALWDKYWESGEKEFGRLDGDEVAGIIESTLRGSTYGQR